MHIFSSRPHMPDFSEGLLRQSAKALFPAQHMHIGFLSQSWFVCACCAYRFPFFVHGHAVPRYNQGPVAEKEEQLRGAHFFSGDAGAVQSPTNSLALWMAAYRPHEGPPKATGEAPPSDTLSTRTLGSSSSPAGHVSSLHHPAPWRDKPAESAPRRRKAGQNRDRGFTSRGALLQSSARCTIFSGL